MEVQLNWNSYKVSRVFRFDSDTNRVNTWLGLIIFSENGGDFFFFFALFVFDSRICCSDLTMEIVRYRLIGPQSHSVLAETLEAATDCDVRISVLST